MKKIKKIENNIVKDVRQKKKIKKKIHGTTIKGNRNLFLD